MVASVVQVALLRRHAFPTERETSTPRGEARAKTPYVSLHLREAMRAIRLRSIRSLADTEFVELRPLTILVGKNSSGKSTFLRILPLLRQSVEARTRGPIQWYGDYVDFGGFDETLSRFAKSREIWLDLRLQLNCMGVHRRMTSPRFGYYYFRRPPDVDPVSCQVTLAIVPDPKDNSVAQFRSIAITAGGHDIHIDIEGAGRVGKILINGREPFAESYSEFRFRPGGLLPVLQRQRRVPRHPQASYPITSRAIYDRSFAIEQLVAELNPMFHGNTKDETKYAVARNLWFGPEEFILTLLQRMRWPGKRWRQRVARLERSDDQFQRIRDLIVANSIGAILEQLDTHLCAFADGVRYAKPIRAVAERYYRQQGLAVDEVDPAGSNLAMFLRSLTDRERRDFQRWTLNQLGWKVVNRFAGGHMTLRIETTKGVEYNLADVGFGFSQVLPVLIQLWAVQHPRLRHRRQRHGPLTLAMEQPELHLHPSFQAELADVLAGAVRASKGDEGGLTLVVETHSETIVSRVGEWVTAGDIEAQDVGIVLFDSVGDGVSKVTMAEFDSEGFLTNWPFGFFDPNERHGAS